MLLIERTCIFRMSGGDDGSRGRIRGGLQCLAQPAKQRLHLLLVQHGRLHQQGAGSGWNQARIVFDRHLHRIFDKPEADGLATDHLADRSVL